MKCMVRDGLRQRYSSVHGKPHTVNYSHRPEHTHTRTHTKLEEKYSLESTDPRESEIRAHLRP